MRYKRNIVAAIAITLALVMTPFAVAEEPAPDATPPPTNLPQLPAIPDGGEPASDQMPSLAPVPQKDDSKPPAKSEDKNKESGNDKDQSEGEDQGAAREAENARLLAAEKARKAAEMAVTKARIKVEKVRAQYRISKFEAKRMAKRSRELSELAEQLRRDMGNLARAAYSSGGEDLNLLATMLAAETPQEVLSGAETAATVAGYKTIRWERVLKTQAKAEEIAKKASGMVSTSKAKLDDAEKELAEATELAEAVDLVIEPTKKTPPVDLSTKSDWVFPTGKGKITSEAGMRLHPILRYVRCHAGADITAPGGTPIFAVDDGIVLQAGSNGGYGNYTLIAHRKGLSSAYAHQQLILVEPGDQVTRGQLIGEVGSTGLSTGAHLHFEALYHGKPYNPRGWLEDKPEMRIPAC